MPSSDVKTEVIVRETPETSLAWTRLWSWLPSENEDDPDEGDH